MLVISEAPPGLAVMKRDRCTLLRVARNVRLKTGIVGGFELGQPRASSRRRVRIRRISKVTRSARVAREDVASGLQFEESPSGKKTLNT